MSTYGPERRPVALAWVLAATPLAWAGIGTLGWWVTR